MSLQKRKFMVYYPIKTKCLFCLFVSFEYYQKYEGGEYPMGSTSNIKYLSMEEFNELIDVIEKVDHSSKFMLRNRVIFLVAEYCGLRASEIGLIELTDLNLRQKTIFCRRLKGSVSNVLKILDNRVYVELEKYYQERLKLTITSKYLFPSKSGRPINRRTLDILMKFYCSFTTISQDKWHFHTLKHTCAMELIAIPSMDVRDVQWWLGHKYINNTMIYLNYSVEAKRELYNKISNHKKTKLR